MKTRFCSRLMREIPLDIIECARKLEKWFLDQDIKEWRIGSVQSIYKEISKCERCGGNEWREPGVDMYFVPCECAKFKIGDRLTKTKGSSWTGKVVGFYSTKLTPIGYAIESENEPGSVQIYPETALRRLT